MGQQTCQGLRWGRVKLPDEEQETREQRERMFLGNGGNFWPCILSPGPGAVLRRASLAGRRVDFLEQPGVAGLGWTRWPEGVLEVMRAGVEASKAANSSSSAVCAASFYGHTALNVPDLV